VRTKLIPALVIALLGIFPVATAVAAPPETTVSFEGSGFGHGVGASQYGAYGRALDGQTYQQILVGPNGYYQGATLKTMGVDIVDPGTVFTNVASDVSATVFTVKQLSTNPVSGVQFVREAQGGSPQTVVVLGNNDTVSVTDTTPGSNQPGGCSVSYILSGNPIDLGIGGCDVTLSLVGGNTNPDYLISATNCRRLNDCTFGYGVALRSVDNASSQRTVFDTIGGCVGCPVWQGFDLVLEATLNDYTLGIKEVPYAWPAEALKAQAIAARSYAASFVAGVDHRARGCFCDVRNDSSSQVFVGWTQNRIYWENWDAATRQTNGVVVSHPQAPDQQIVRAYYSSSNGGASEASGEKWKEQHPYLVSIPDPWSLTAPDNQYASWSVPTTAGDLVLRAWGQAANYELTDAEVIETNTSGSAKTIRFTAKDANGTIHTRDFPVTTVFGWYELPSWYFTINVSGLSGTFVDDDGSIFEDDVEWLAAKGITKGCTATKFCGSSPVTRGQLAALVHRALDPYLSVDMGNAISFSDTAGTEFAADIAWLSAAGITMGCESGKYCPHQTTTRGQMAAFLQRAFGDLIPAPTPQPHGFGDVASNTFQTNIQWLADTGITTGCSTTAFCPLGIVNRYQFAAFVHRAFIAASLP